VKGIWQGGVRNTESVTDLSASASRNFSSMFSVLYLSNSNATITHCMPEIKHDTINDEEQQELNKSLQCNLFYELLKA
jgi:hypothetical protein